jgi:hypothetical protein
MRPQSDGSVGAVAIAVNTDSLDPGQAPPAGLFRTLTEGNRRMGSVVKKRRKRMAKKKHRKLLRKTRVQRRRLGK